MKIAHFKEDITPPVGHPLCAGWYPVAKAIGERLSAHGVILEEDGEAPMVLCALDWAELSNHEHLRWRESLAKAAGTEADRVTIHCVHNHDSPWPDEEAQALLDQHGMPDLIMQREWCHQVRESVAGSVAEAVKRLEVVDQVRFGKALVQELASNRRPLGEDGKVVGVRWTQCREANIRALPEGDIDPWLWTVSFWQRGKKLVVLHYYTIHPTSYDGTGIVTNDFVGIARDRLIAEEGVPHIYFTGCAGNITAGKYNDGVQNNRELFTKKIYDAMKAADAGASDAGVPKLDWRTCEIRLPKRSDVTDAELMERIRNEEYPKKASRAALELVYRQRVDSLPVTISALHFGNEAILLHLPGEAFIEYQLYAQNLRPGTWIGTAAYGDLGPGYICMENSFEEGGYEPTDSFCAPESEKEMKRGIEAII